MQLAFGKAGRMTEQSRHGVMTTVGGFDALTEHHVAAALAVHGTRFGEASGAAVALLLLRAALACHTGMATFAEAGVSDKPADGAEPKAAS